jgi:hypothetical protein
MKSLLLCCALVAVGCDVSPPVIVHDAGHGGGMGATGGGAGGGDGSSGGGASDGGSNACTTSDTCATTEACAADGKCHGLNLGQGKACGDTNCTYSDGTYTCSAALGTLCYRNCEHRSECTGKWINLDQNTQMPISCTMPADCCPMGGDCSATYCSNHVCTDTVVCCLNLQGTDMCLIQGLCTALGGTIAP